MSKAHDPRTTRRILCLNARGERLWSSIDTKRGSNRRLVQALEESSRDSLWILPNAVTTSRLIEALRLLFHERTRPGLQLGSLLLLESVKPGAAPLLHGLFDTVIGAASSFKHLPYGELLEVLQSPDQDSRDLFIGGWSDPGSGFLILVRADLRTTIAPFTLFEPTPSARPDFRKLAFEDHGHTVRLGRYEASADSILYELDPDYRRRLNARRRASEQGLGPALRRLRKQRGLSRSDFPGVNEKTLARIERGEVSQPHARTLARIEKRLGMSRDEIASY